MTRWSRSVEHRLDLYTRAALAADGSPSLDLEDLTLRGLHAWCALPLADARLARTALRAAGLAHYVGLAS